ncbi:hypothetical protein CHS0354_042645 [Potamilus streckersoni]|uniref:Uncharacterized protein n=1 Tax=Potamilus streckersoni TaxID=2493646 RepID=A0AAE0TEX1_9BIVA|nr:hypothetical protein CHS0354_042645 [Potamilus streckersoni]
MSETSEDGDVKKPSLSSIRKISFPADSILNAVIQDGDVQELLRILHHRRSEVNINHVNHVGLTALHHAVLSNNLDAVKILLSHGADVNCQDVHGFSPLHTAAACGFLQVTSLLVLFGADVFSLTRDTELPIDVAKDISVIRLLGNEMCCRIHNKIYMSELVKLRLKQCWTIIKTLVTFVWITLLIVITFLYTLVKPKHGLGGNHLDPMMTNTTANVPKTVKGVDVRETVIRRVQVIKLEKTQ